MTISTGCIFAEYPEGEIDEKKVTVGQAIAVGRRFGDEYDFGDSWRHDVVVEDASSCARGLKSAPCYGQDIDAS